MKEESLSCRDLLIPAEAKSNYQYADSIVRKFAEESECRRIRENLDANIATLNMVSQNHCMGDLSKQMFETAKNNVGIEASDWDKKCKGYTSSPGRVGKGPAFSDTLYHGPKVSWYPI